MQVHDLVGVLGQTVLPCLGHHLDGGQFRMSHFQPIDGGHGASQRVVPSLSGHRIGIHGRHETLKDGHKNGIPGVEVAVDGHGRHAQLAAQGAHGKRTEAIALDEVGGHGDNALAGERRTRLDHCLSGHGPSFLAHCEPGFYALVSQYRETTRPAGRAAFFAIRNPEPSAALLQTPSSAPRPDRFRDCAASCGTWCTDCR